MTVIEILPTLIAKCTANYLALYMWEAWTKETITPCTADSGHHNATHGRNGKPGKIFFIRILTNLMH
jgi:hypothetical protein